MAVNKIVTGTTLNIEFQKGVDKSGDPLYTKSATFPISKMMYQSKMLFMLQMLSKLF